MSILSFLTLAREPSVTGRLTLTMAAVEPKRRHFQSISKNVLKYAAEHCGEQAAKHWKVKSFKKLKFLNRNGFALWPQWLRRTQGDRPWLLPACERKKFDIKFAIVFVISTQNIFILRCELILWCECSRRGLHFVYYCCVLVHWRQDADVPVCSNSHENRGSGFYPHGMNQPPSVPWNAELSII